MNKDKDPPMTSEVNYELKIELSDLNNLFRHLWPPSGLQAASKWPQMTSDELSGLNNQCSNAFLAPKGFLEPFVRKEGRTKWTCRPACSYLAAGKKTDD